MERYSEQEIEIDPLLADIFVYRRKLLTGFKYRFNFILDNSEEPVVDEN